MDPVFAVVKGLMAFEVKKRTGCSSERAVEAVDAEVSSRANAVPAPLLTVEVIESAIARVESAWRR